MTTSPPKPAEPEPIIITTDYSKFNTVSVSLFGREWQVKAGHHFDSETDPTWSSAWCYSEQEAEGVEVTVGLAERATPSASPIAPTANEVTLQRVGLSVTQAQELATWCPWLDKRKYSPSDMTTPARLAPAPTPAPEVALYGNVLRYTGDITADFLDVVSRYDFETLEIDSGGGLVEQGVAAGRWLRDNGKTVLISKSCLSACVFVLAGGTTRSATGVAHIGVHQFSFGGTADPASAIDAAQRASAGIVEYLSEMGIDSALFTAMSRVPPEEIAYIDHEQLLAWRLLTGPLPQSDQEWFEALSEPERLRVQTDLLLLGHYGGFVDGAFGSETRKALSSYRQRNGFQEKQGLSADEIDALHADAGLVFNSFGFELVESPRASVAALIPRSLLLHEGFRQGDPTYETPDSSIIMALSSEGLLGGTFNDLFSRESDTARGSEITYSNFSQSRFVVAGSERGRKFYKIVYRDGLQAVGYTVSWEPMMEMQAKIISMLVASNFAPLNEFRNIEATRERLMRTLFDY